MDTFERIIDELQRIAPRCRIECATARRYEERWRAELCQLKRELEDLRCRALVVYNRPMSLVTVERAERWSFQWIERHFAEKFNRPYVLWVRPDGTWEIHYLFTPLDPIVHYTIKPHRSRLWYNSLYGHVGETKLGSFTPDAACGVTYRGRSAFVYIPE